MSGLPADFGAFVSGHDLDENEPRPCANCGLSGYTEWHEEHRAWLHVLGGCVGEWEWAHRAVDQADGCAF